MMFLKQKSIDVKFNKIEDKDDDTTNGLM